MQKLSAVTLRKLTSYPGMILLGVALVMLIVLSGAVLAQEEIEVPPPYAGLENPFPWNDTSAQEAGMAVFQEFCVVCHVATEDIPALGPEFSAVDYRQSLEERADFYFWTVSEGRLEKAMPPWGPFLSEEARWQVLTYIWSLGGAGPTPTPTLTTTPTPTPTLTPVITGDPTTGREIFQENCQVCHSIGGGKVVGPDLKDVTERREESWLKVQIQFPSVHLEQNDPIAMALLEEFRLPMPDLGLTEQQVEAVIAYLETAEIGQAAIPAKFIPTLVIGILVIVGITLIGLIAGTKRVEVRS